jgi:ankyrin repeat protein
MDPNGDSYLACALDGDSASAFAVLVKLGADIAAQRAVKTHDHLFVSAASWGCDEILALMLKQGWVDIELRNAEGRTALHCAAAAANLTSVQILLDAGADIGAIDDGGRTALEFAEGNKSITRLLLDSGATHSPLGRIRNPRDHQTQAMSG